MRHTILTTMTKEKEDLVYIKENEDLLLTEKTTDDIAYKPRMYIIEAGLLTSYGVLYVDIIERLEVDKVEVSWIGSIRTGIYLGAAPLIVPFTKMVSCRILMVIGGIIAFSSLMVSVFLKSFMVLLICLGIFQGVAFALVFVSSNIIVNLYFDKKRPLAIGLAVCGAGVGQTVYPLLQDALLKQYGFSGTMLINAALTLHIILSGSTYFPLPTKKTLNTNKKKYTDKNKSILENLQNAFDFKVFKIPLFVVFVLHNILLYIGAYVPFSFLPLRVNNRGFSLNDASLFVSMIGLASTTGRILVGFMASYMTNFRSQLYVILTFIAGMMVCIAPLCSYYTEFILFSWGFGIATASDWRNFNQYNAFAHRVDIEKLILNSNKQY
ncbi:hypothetical protein KUTeg_008815 [Tegillarca granosa]|uniref:Uncharacterized protein n=1 Tax=Tegillarca granosa TaxID=220873 RepID=A0ABQ9FA86_TEGGR|nr:hypothetical protein KUTeg_008815 [Tegillarca granosa]